MTAFSHIRGHAIEGEGLGYNWVWADTREPVLGNEERPCSHCGLWPTDDGHDACIASLPGVTNACCGYGVPERAYLQFRDGSFLKGREACEAMHRLAPKAKARPLTLLPLLV